MTDLKTLNTLYDTEIKKGILIDLGGVVKVNSEIELKNFDMKQWNGQSTIGYESPELQEYYNGNFK